MSVGRGSSNWHQGALLSGLAGYQAWLRGPGEGTSWLLAQAAR